MKGKTNAPLRILVDPQWLERPELKELLEKGHIVEMLDAGADFIMSEKAWHWHESLWKMLPVALKSMRRLKKEKGKKNDED